MKQLEVQNLSVTDGSENVGLAKFLKANYNEISEWVQNSRNSTESFLCNGFFQNQILSPKKFQTEEVIQAWLAFYISKLLLVAPGEINIHLPFEYYSITSIEILRLTHALEVWLGLRLSTKLLYGYPTVSTLAQSLAKKVEYGC